MPPDPALSHVEVQGSDDEVDYGILRKQFQHLRSSSVATLVLPDADIGDIDFLKDNPREMTWGRRIALRLASWSKWYNPYLGETEGPHGGEPPSLAKAWAFFEHVTLERYIIEEDHKSTKDSSMNCVQRIKNMFHRGDRQLEIAEPGERRLRTKLYNPVTTPLSQMGDFGLGYGVYFSTLRKFAMLFFLLGMLNLPNLIFFASEEYSNGQFGVATLLRGSAICTNTSWVPCPDCPEEYQYAEIGFSKWSHTNAKTVRFDERGEWVNVTEYTFLEANETLSREYLYESGEVFDILTLTYFDAIFNITVTNETIRIGGIDEIQCPRANHCLEDLCECQIENFNDCYCKFGNSLPEANLEVSYLGFAEKNNCDGATLRNGYINLASVIIFMVGVFIIRLRQDELEIKFDEDEQTAQDYSICVTNPPTNAYNPTEWKCFFEDNFDCKVTVCTVDVNNDRLVRLLVRRRMFLERLRLLLPGVKLKRKKLYKAVKKDKHAGGREAMRLFRLFCRVDDAIKESLREEKTLPVSSVFVTFETESGQRDVLQKLTVGSWAIFRNDKSRLSSHRYLFRGKHLLDIAEPEEPSAIRWQEMHSTVWQILKGLLLTTTICMVIFAFAVVVIMFAFSAFPHAASYVNTGFSIAFPEFAKLMMNLEKHRSESSRQTWLFVKIACFDVMITSVLISAVNPFTVSLDPRIDSLPGLLPAVHALFLSQMTLSPIIQLMDPFGNLKRHVLGPRAVSQGEMNRHFIGTEYFLAERYAILVKFVFLIVWYCALYPIGFFFGSFALLIAYFADRFSLMRSWARTPQLGTQISDVARNYFLPCAMALMAVTSAYSWSGFPYDNLCEIDDEEDGAELSADAFAQEWALRERGTRTEVFGFSLFRAPDVLENVSVPRDTKVYRYCLQDFRAYFNTPSFPPLPKFQRDPWMTPDQEDLLGVYGWVALGVVVVAITTMLWRYASKTYYECFGAYTPRGNDMRIRFSDCPSMDTYIPSFQPQFGYPLLLCDVRGLHPDLFSWTDPDRSHSFYDVTRDVADILDAREIRKRNVFARVRHWPHGQQSGRTAKSSVPTGDVVAVASSR